MELTVEHIDRLNHANGICLSWGAITIVKSAAFGLSAVPAAGAGFTAETSHLK
jgi:hypothetical protein